MKSRSRDHARTAEFKNSVLIEVIAPTVISAGDGNLDRKSRRDASATFTAAIAKSQAGLLARRGGSAQRPHVTHQIPYFLIILHLPKSRHPGKSHSILNNPK